MRHCSSLPGANKGIGFELVRQLASADPTLTVLMGARDPARGSASAAALGLSNVAPLALDVSSAASVKAAAAEVSRRYGKLDLLVCNAGVFLKDGRDVSGVAADIDATLAPNYYGVRDCCSAFIPILNANGRSVIRCCLLPLLQRSWRCDFALIDCSCLADVVAVAVGIAAW